MNEPQKKFLTGFVPTVLIVFFLAFLFDSYRNNGLINYAADLGYASLTGTIVGVWNALGTLEDSD
jgi:hypothetical protein